MRLLGLFALLCLGNGVRGGLFGNIGSNKTKTHTDLDETTSKYDGDDLEEDGYPTPRPHSAGLEVLKHTRSTDDDQDYIDAVLKEIEEQHQARNSKVYPHVSLHLSDFLLDDDDDNVSRLANLSKAESTTKGHGKLEFVRIPTVVNENTDDRDKEDEDKVVEDRSDEVNSSQKEDQPDDVIVEEAHKNNSDSTLAHDEHPRMDDIVEEAPLTSSEMDDEKFLPLKATTEAGRRYASAVLSPESVRAILANDLPEEMFGAGEVGVRAGTTNEDVSSEEMDRFLKEIDAKYGGSRQGANARITEEVLNPVQGLRKYVVEVVDSNDRAKREAVKTGGAVPAHQHTLGSKSAEAPSEGRVSEQRQAAGGLAYSLTFADAEAAKPTRPAKRAAGLVYRVGPARHDELAPFFRRAKDDGADLEEGVEGVDQSSSSSSSEARSAEADARKAEAGSAKVDPKPVEVDVRAMGIDAKPTEAEEKSTIDVEPVEGLGKPHDTIPEIEPAFSDRAALSIPAEHVDRGFSFTVHLGPFALLLIVASVVTVVAIKAFTYFRNKRQTAYPVESCSAKTQMTLP